MHHEGGADEPVSVDVELSVYAPRNQEVVLRLQTIVPADGSLAAASEFATFLRSVVIARTVVPVADTRWSACRLPWAEGEL